MIRNGDVIKRADGEFKCVGVGPASTDQKFFGRRVFTLRKLGTNDLYLASGKTVTSTSRLVKKESK